MNVLICIPAYNAAGSIATVICQTQAAVQNCPGRFQILVINDGSTDETLRAAGLQSVQVISHHRNMGKGMALRTGFQKAIQGHFDWVVTMDSDLQHDPSLIPQMLNRAVKHNYDIVIGSRHFDPKKMSPARIFSNATTTWLISKRVRQPIDDSQSGYRVIRTSILERLVLRTNRYETESELLIKAGQAGARIGSYRIETLYGGEKSHIHHVRDTLRFIRMYVRTFFE